MSEENKLKGEGNEQTENKKEETTNPLTKGKKKQEDKSAGETTELILGKYKSQEELVSAYKSLESKLGKKAELGKMNSDELAAYFKENYGNHKFDSTLDGELADLSNELSQRTGIPAPLADFMASESVSRVLGNQAKINKNEVHKLINDDKFKDEFVAGLEAGKQNLDEVWKDIEKGQVSVAQAKAWASIGKQKPEGTLKETREEEKTQMAVEEAYMEIQKLTEVGGPYWNVHDPMYVEVKKRVNQLKHQFNL